MSSSRNNWGAGVTTALVALPILYLLSIGPLVYAVEKSGRPVDAKMDAALTVFYAPLTLLAQHTPLDKPLLAYIDWWSDLGKKP